MKDEHAMSIYVVTGGAGFLGSHLCERLLADGHGVLCVDNYFTGSKENICHLLDRFCLGDLTCGAVLRIPGGTHSQSSVIYDERSNC